jgi:PKD repeat protein
MLAAAAAPVAGQVYCADPPAVSLLTGETVSVSGLASEGHPSSFKWYVTPPGQSVSAVPTSTDPTHSFTPAMPGIWSIGLTAKYSHFTAGGWFWSSDDCITVRASSVVASISLADHQIATDETLPLSGSASRWASGVVPEVEWRIDGLPLGSCNGGPPPSSPSELGCVVPANWLAPGWHTAGLLLTDSATGETSLATGDFEVIEVIPLSVDFSWSPTNPDPGQLVHFIASLTPLISESELTRVTWDLGDGTIVEYDSCPTFFGSCLEWPHTYGVDNWYDVSLVVQTADETASSSHQIEVGDPVPTPVSSFTPSPSTPDILQNTALTFDGSCQGQCQWSWSFGDGSQSTAQNPTYSWLVPATYTATLTVTNQTGSDVSTLDIEVRSCWAPDPPNQWGHCHGGEVFLGSPLGNAYLWSTGVTTRWTAAPHAGPYWVNVESGTGCWGHAPITVVLNNCGSAVGDTNRDGVTDAADTAALIPELTDGDGDTVIGAGGGDLTAPGGDVDGDQRLRADDLLTTLMRLFQ